METSTQIVGLIMSGITLLGIIVAVVYKFARGDSRIESLYDQLEKTTEMVEAHLNDKSAHQDPRLAEEFRRSTERRLDDQAMVMQKINEKLDILIGFKR